MVGLHITFIMRVKFHPSFQEEFRPAILNANLLPFLSSMLQSGKEELEGEAARMLSRFLIYG